MGIKLVINISKKIPGPTDYSSVQASCSIEGELIIGQDAGTECARLYSQAESAVDAQLHLTAAPAINTTTSNSGPTSAPAPSATRSYPRTGRQVALVTPSQLGLINRLLDETNTDANAVMLHYQVSSLNQMTCKNSSALIDELKARQTSTRS